MAEALGTVVVNLSMPGTSSNFWANTDIPSIFNTWFFMGNPRIIISLGTNDPLFGVTYVQFTTFLSNIVADLEASDVILLQLPTHNGDPQYWPLRDGYAQVQEALANSSPNVSLIDLRSLGLSDPVTGEDHYFQFAPGQYGTHPRPFMQQKIALHVKDFLLGMTQ